MKSPPPCPTAKLYNAMKDADSITPKIIDDIKSVEIVEGNGGPGTIKKLTIVEALLVEGPNGESIGKLSVKFHSKGDSKPDEEDMKKGKAKGEALFKAIEGYDSANPAQY
ncbi:ABA-responsive protein ABR18-like [Arachis hypogaea]|uniref:ABA-responsive protein ABR18-like n=1 Tax=Arachis hypogaea TaxID=3818 RepID=UPI003B04D477